LTTDPRRLSWTTAPLTMKTFSYDGAPEMTTAPAGPPWLTPGASEIVPTMVRATGRFSMSLASRLVATWFDSRAAVAGALATMTIEVDNGETVRSASERAVCD